MFVACSRKDERQRLFEVTEELLGLSGNACYAQAFTIQGWPVLKRPEVAGFEAPNDNNGDSQVELRFAGENALQSLGAELERLQMVQRIKDCERENRRGVVKQRRKAKAMPPSLRVSG